LSEDEHHEAMNRAFALACARIEAVRQHTVARVRFAPGVAEGVVSTDGAVGKREPEPSGS
jgi:hypothetical protein